MSVVKNPNKVYIGNIPRDADEGQIEKMFEEVGKTLSLEFKGDFAFVEYADSQAAEEAIRKYDGARIRGRRLIVEPFRYRGGDPRYRKPPPKVTNRGEHRCIVTNLSANTTKEALREWVMHEKLTSVTVTDNEGVVEFKDKQDWDYCIRKLDHVKLDGCYVRVYDEREYNRRKLKIYDRPGGNRGGFRRSRSGSKGRGGGGGYGHNDDRGPPNDNQGGNDRFGGGGGRGGGGGGFRGGGGGYGGGGGDRYGGGGGGYHGGGGGGGRGGFRGGGRGYDNNPRDRGYSPGPRGGGRFDNDRGGQRDRDRGRERFRDRSNSGGRDNGRGGGGYNDRGRNDDNRGGGYDNRGGGGYRGGRDQSRSRSRSRGRDNRGGGGGYDNRGGGGDRDNGRDDRGYGNRGGGRGRFDDQPRGGDRGYDRGYDRR